MVNPNKLLNSLVERGMTASSQSRIENSMGDDALANILEQQFGVPRKLVPMGAPASQDSPWESREPEAMPAPRPSRVPTSAGSSASRPANVPQPRGGAEKPAGSGLPDLGGLFGKSFK